MAINAISSIVNSAQQISKAGATQQSESSFSNILTQAIDNIEETEAEVQLANDGLLTGETDDIHTALIASQKAEIAVSLAVEVRNRVLEAYNSVMNMQV